MDIEENRESAETKLLPHDFIAGEIRLDEQNRKFAELFSPPEHNGCARCSE